MGEQMNIGRRLEAWAREELRRPGGHSGEHDARMRDVIALAEAFRATEEGAQAEPVCPEGVKAAPWRVHQGQEVWGTRIGVEGSGYFLLLVHPCGRIEPLGKDDSPSPALLRYAAALSEHCARLHAEGDRQRKLDAVKAAEEAAKAAGAALQDASRKADAAYMVLAKARREAGL